MKLESAIVKLARIDPATGKEEFVGSGFFIAARRILTAAHNLASMPLLVRPYIGGSEPLTVSSSSSHDGGLDVAVLEIDSMHYGCTFLPLSDLDSKPAAELTMCGYAASGQESVPGITVLHFQDSAKHWVMDEKQPKGHSGSALCLADGRVWAVVVRRPADHGTIRGCAIAAYQFLPWLRQQLPQLPVAASSPAIAEWSDHVASARSGLRVAFGMPTFAALDGELKRDSTNLPAALVTELADTRRETLGERLVEAVIALAKACNALLMTGTPAMSPGARKQSREGFESAMGAAVQLCIDPSMRAARNGAAAGQAASELVVRADSSAGAGLVIRDRPHKTWDIDSTDLTLGVRDRFLIDVPLELGEGRDRETELDRAAWANLAGLDRLPDQLDDRQRRRMHGLAASEAKEGRERIFRLDGQSGDDARRDSVNWISTKLRMRVLVHLEPHPNEPSAFLYDEWVLVQRIKVFLEILQNMEKP